VSRREDRETRQAKRQKGKAMNNLEKLLQDYEATKDNIDAALLLGIIECSNCPASDFCKGINNDSCSITRLSWLLQEYVERDSWEKIEADASASVPCYWGCSGFNCNKCPAKIDGKRPHERFNTRGCDLAQQIDLIRRCKALAGVE
jgi:hypothetical protein